MQNHDAGLPNAEQNQEQFGAKKPRRRLILLSLALLLTLLPFSAYNVVLPLLQIEWSMNNAWAGGVYAAYLAGSALSAFFLVPLSDRMPPKYLWLAGLLTMTTGHLLFTTIPAGPSIAAFWRALTGAGYILALTAGIRLVAFLLPERRATTVGFFAAAGFIGTTGSFIVTGQLLSLLGTWRMAYLAVTAMAMLGIPLAVAGVVGLEDPKPVVGSVRRAGRLDFLLLRDPSLRRIIFVYALHTADLYFARLWLPLLIGSLFAARGSDVSRAAAQGSTVAGLMFIAGAFAVFGGGWLADRWGRLHTVTFIYALAIGASALVGWLVQRPLLLLSVGAIYAVAAAADSSIYSTLLIEAAPADRVGAAQALQSFVGFGIGAIWPVLIGIFVDQTANQLGWGGLFTLNALVISLGLIALVRPARTT